MVANSSGLLSQCRSFRHRPLILAAYVVVDDPLDSSSIPLPLPTPPPLSLILRARLTLLMTPSSLSIPWSRKHTGASAVGDVCLDVLSLLLPHPTHPVLSSRSGDHLPLPMPLPRLPIPQTCHRDAATSAVVPESSIPWTHRLFLFLHQRLRRCRWLHRPVSEIQTIFGLLTLYFFLWQFALVTVGRTSLPYLVWNYTVENSWGVSWIPR